MSVKASLAQNERRVLAGKRVLVTRPNRQASALVRRLEELGAVVQVLSAVDIRAISDWAPVDRALAALADYQWLVFTSANGVHALIGRLLELGREPRVLGALQLAAIGPATAGALRDHQLAPAVVPEVFCSESLAAALKEKVRGQRVLLARADRGRDVLRQELAQVAQVDQVAVYSQVDAIAPGAAILDGIDYITLTSANIARALCGALDAQARGMVERGGVQLVSISPITSAAIRALGMPVAAEAAEYTISGVVQALVKLVESFHHRGTEEKTGMSL